MNTIKTLIVDDQIQVAESLSKTLSLNFSEQLEVEICRSAETALDVLEQRPFDLLITDWHLPGMSGLALILRARKKFPDLKIVFMSLVPLAEIEDKVELIADMSIRKPFHASMVATQLHSLFTRDGVAA